MEQITKDAISTRRMWRNYALGWAVYMLVLTMAQQVDNIGLHRFNWHVLTITVSSVAPQALILALHWPLSGWFERKRVPVPLICLIHVAGALAFTALCYGPVMMSMPNKSMAYNIWPLFYFIMGYGVVAALFYMVRANAARQRQAAAIQQAHSLLITTELNALRNKLNPHFFPLALNEIAYLKADSKYTAIAARDQTFLVRIGISELEARLDPTRFIRVHRSALVNLDFVDSMKADDQSQLIIQMRDGATLTASREASKILREMAI
ncbi:LytTR family DNA-binding domain-containing protein [Massilia sp. 9096]|uniref:LytTR family DNA-binding domain-containing protein n=1 Tax=Massilia sp. 9096 TaxID=1500894 RepID=UPI001EFAE650|nr:LytTR family DNA-binding domain-containing protein [Massilia sp. 9096]